jgi:hypothetical protein
LKAVVAPRSATLVLAAAVAGVMAPLAVWNPGALDDARLDTGVLAFAGLAAVLLLALLARRLPAPVPGTFVFYAGLGMGLLPLLFVPWAASQAGLADRAALLSAWALAGVAASGVIEVERLVRWLLTGCAAASAYALATWTGFDPLGWKPWPEAPPVAPYGGSNHGGELLTPLLVAAAALLPGLRRHPLAWAAAGLCALHAGVFGVLAGRISLAAGLGLAAWRRPEARPGAGLLAVCFLAGETLRAVLAAPTAAPPPESALPPSLQIRAELYLAASDRIPREPIGIGLGRFEADYPEWRSPEEARLSTNDRQARVYLAPKSLHNDLMQVILECGWLGGALLFAAILLIARPAPPWFQAPLLAFAVHAVVRSPLLDNPPALALFALLCGAAARAPANLLTAAQPTRSRVGGLLIVAGALAAVIPARGHIAGENAVAAALRAGEPDPAAALQRATLARPWDARGWELRGLGYLAVQEWEYARRCFEHALAHQPTALGALTGLVQVEMSAPDGDRARGLELLARAERLAGRHPAVGAARVGWLDAVATAHRAEGETRRTALHPLAGSYLLSAELAAARAALAREDADGARAALRRGALFAGAHRALLERTARRESLDDALLAELTLRIFPRWPDNLAAAAAGGDLAN